MISIKDKNGIKRCSVEVTDKCIYYKALMEEEYVLLSFDSDTVIPLAKGDYIDTEYGRFYIVGLEKPKRGADGGYAYEQKFHAEWERLRNRLTFYDRQKGSEKSWKMTQTPEYFLDIIAGNIYSAGYGQYSYEVDASLTEMKLVEFDATNIINALSAVAEAWETEWWITDNVIHLGRCEFGSAVQLRLDDALSDIDRDSGQDTEYITRLYAFGSTRNLKKNYRKDDGTSAVIEGVVETRLKLPAGVPYVDAWENMQPEDIVEGVAVFENIYPRRTGTIASVSAKQYTDTIENEDGTTSEEKWNAFRFTDAGLTFSADYVIEGEELRIVFLSGKLAGMDFAVTFNPDGLKETDSGCQIFEIVRNEDYGIALPTDDFKPSVGDTYILYGYDTAFVADHLVPDAEEELLDAATDYVAKTSQDKSLYTCKTDPIRCAGYKEDESGRMVYSQADVVDLDVGQCVTLHDPNYFGTGCLTSRIRSFEKRLENRYDCTYTVGESGAYSRRSELQEQIDELTYQSKSLTNVYGSAVYLIKRYDTTAPTDNNAFSSKRAQYEFISAKDPDTAEGLIKFRQGIEAGKYVEDAGGAKIDDRGNTELGTLKTRGNTSVSGTLTVQGHTNLKDTSVFGNEYVQGNLNVGKSISNGNFSVTPYGTVTAALDIISLKGRMTAAEGFRSADFSPGLDGTGAAMYKDGDSWVVCADMVDVRKKIRAREAEIQKETHVGGCIVVSPAACRVAHAEFGYYVSGTGKQQSCYDIYFYAEDSDGNRVTNDFRTGDLVRCRTFNLAPTADGTVQNRYWWRKALYVSESPVSVDIDGQTATCHRVALSLDPDCDAYSDAPMAGDVCFTVGNSTDTGRQNVIMIAAYGGGSPYIYQYSGIDSYSLPDSKLVTRISPQGNRFTGEFRIVNSDGTVQGATDWVMQQLDAAVAAESESLRAEFAAGLEGLSSTVEMVSERNVAHNLMWPALESVKSWSNDGTCTLEALDGWFVRLTPVQGLVGDVLMESRDSSGGRFIPLKKGDRVTVSLTVRRPQWLPHHTVTVPMTLFVITSPTVCGNDPHRLTLSFADGNGGMADSVRVYFETEALGTADHSFRIHYHVQEVAVDTSYTPIEERYIEFGEICVTRGWGYGPLPWDSATAQLHTATALNTRNYSELKQTADGISTRVEQQRTAIGDLGTDIDALGGRVAVNETSISELEQTARGISSTVKQHTEAIGLLDSDMDGLCDDIIGLDGQVATVKTAMSQIRQTADEIRLSVSRTDGADNLAAEPLLKTFPDGWYKSPGMLLKEAPWDNFFQMIQESGSDGKDGHTFTWNRPTGEYFLRINFYAAGTWWVRGVRITGEGSSANLLSNSDGTYTRTYIAPGDHYENLTDCTISMVQGGRYTIYAQTNCIPTDNHSNDRTKGYVTLWLCSAASSPQGAVNNIVSGTDMFTGPWKGYTELWGVGSTRWDKIDCLTLAAGDTVTASFVVRKPSWWQHAMQSALYGDGQAVDIDVMLAYFTSEDAPYAGLTSKHILSFADGAEEELVVATFTVDVDCRACLRIDGVKPWEGLESSFGLYIGRVMLTKGAGYVPFTLTPAKTKAAGIDIDAGRIALRADTVCFEDSDGNAVGMFTSDGKLSTRFIDADELEVTRVDARNDDGAGATVNEDGSSGEYRIYGEPVREGLTSYHHPLVILGLATVNVTKTATLTPADTSVSASTASAASDTPSAQADIGDITDLGETTETVQVFVRGFDAKGNLLWWQRCDNGQRETKYVSFEYRDAFEIGLCSTQTSLPDSNGNSRPATATLQLCYRLYVDDNTSDQQAAQLSGLYSYSKAGLGAFDSARLSGVYYGAEAYKSWNSIDSQGYMWQYTGYTYTGYLFANGRLSRQRDYTRITSYKKISDLPLTPALTE